MSEMLPCPFCGKDPVYLETIESDNFVRCSEILCDECAIGVSEEYKHETVTRWNTRASTARIEALEKALRDTTCELSACAHQLTRGKPVREGGSVDRALKAARALIEGGGA